MDHNRKKPEKVYFAFLPIFGFKKKKKETMHFAKKSPPPRSAAHLGRNFFIWGGAYKKKILILVNVYLIRR